MESWKRATESSNKIRDCQEIEEESVAKKQMEPDELSMQQERNLSLMSQLLTQIEDLQNKENSWNDARDFHDLETASSTGSSHVPSQSLKIPLPRGSALILACSLTRNSLGESAHVCESLPVREGPSSALFEN